MNTLFLGSAAGALAAFGGLAIFFGLIIGLLYFLFPLIVMWQLRGIKIRMDQQMEAQQALLKMSIEEGQRQNILTRQLLIAYGHEPEA